MKRESGSVNRRQALKAISVAAGAAALGGRSLAAAAVEPHRMVMSGLWPDCVVTPTQTEGPYFVDQQAERADVRVDPVDGAVSAGLALRLRMSVHRVDGQSCTPLTGAQVDLWQCDALGIYAGVLDGRGLFDTRGKKFLRGYQMTNANGAVEFLTVYPGWYQGRTPHIHFKVRLATGSQRAYEFTSQLYFDDAVTDRVYARAPYSTKGTRDTRNERDGIYRREGGRELLVRLTEEREQILGGFDIGLRIT